MLATTTVYGISHPVCRIAFGCEQLGGHAWGNCDIAAIEAAIALAVDAGVTLFDTADCYGLGTSETRLGQALRPYRDRVTIATKFGVRIGNDGKASYDSSPEWARTALEASLRRLGSSYVDLFQMHYWDGVTPLVDTLAQLESLRAAGKIRAYGVTNVVPDLHLIRQFPGLATLSLELSLAERRHQAAVTVLAAHGLSFIAYGSLGQGVLTGKYGETQRFADNDRRARQAYVNFHGARYEKNLRVVRALREHAAALGVTIPQIAIAWILHRIPNSIALAGIKSAAQLSDVCGALRVDLDEDVLRNLDQVSAASAAELQ